MIRLQFFSDTNETHFINWISEMHPDILGFFQRQGPFLECSVDLSEEVINAVSNEGGVVLQK